jgi:hypothetical protein
MSAYEELAGNERPAPKAPAPTLRHQWRLLARGPDRVQRDQCRRCGVTRTTTTCADRFPIVRYQGLNVTNTGRAPPCAIPSKAAAPNPASPIAG